MRFGALVMVVTIALDPFAQQLVQFDQEMRFTADTAGQAKVPFANRYSKGSVFSLSLPGITGTLASA